MDGGDDALVAGVDDLEGLAVYALDELVVDEAVGVKLSVKGFSVGNWDCRSI